jgi:N-acyl-D-aspartate/D-glutamate deacylase
MTAHDLVIRNGTIIDGSGAPAFEGDVAVTKGRIAAVGPVAGQGREEIDAKGKLVTPGFVDIHTHYDGQATWDSRLSPSSQHGVTTAVFGNCGVGFAPCRAEDHDRLISLMEGVEDIPHPVLKEGLAWNWESFGEYLSALEAIPHDIDFAAQLPHGAGARHRSGYLPDGGAGARGDARRGAGLYDLAHTEPPDRRRASGSELWRGGA